MYLYFGSQVLTLLICLFKVKLALQMKDLGVVGIDLSGNPVIGEW